MRVLCLLLALFVAGCAETTITEITPDRFRISYTETFLPDPGISGALLQHLTKKADETCPTGWEKLRELKKGSPAGPVTILEIRCLSD